ncbi:MAG: phosphoribosyltransferase family protein [Acidobacteriota bacterium]
MELIPTQEEVIELLRRTGGMRDGHFQYPNGLHVPQYLQVALTMRDFNVSNVLGVALSRKLRSNSDIRAMLPNLSIVAPATGGLPVAYGVAEALRTNKVYWAERENAGAPLRFRQYLELEKGEKVVIVDDILRTGAKLAEMKALIESAGGVVVGMAVIVHQPSPAAQTFGDLPFYTLAKIVTPTSLPKDCELCKRGVPLEQVWL